MQMMFSNNSVQATLEGERKRTPLIAKRASRRANGWVGSLRAAIQKEHAVAAVITEYAVQ